MKKISITANLQIQHKQGLIEVRTTGQQHIQVNLSNKAVLRHILRSIPLSFLRKQKEMLPLSHIKNKITIYVNDRKIAETGSKGLSPDYIYLLRQYILARLA